MLLLLYNCAKDEAVTIEREMTNIITMNTTINTDVTDWTD